jgi:hypothetical protein
MQKRGWLALAISLLLLIVAFYGYQRYNTRGLSARGNLLEMMPANAGAVLFADLAQLRTAPFVAQLYSWAPQPEPDEDYARFLKETGFNYERDLDRLAIAIKETGQDSTFFAVAEGRFDREKISTLAVKSGTVERRGGREIFAVASDGGARKIHFTFLRNDRIALTDGQNLDSALGAKKQNEDTTEWRLRFERLAGSPIFAVIRQEAAPGAALSAQAPGGFRSPQLSALLDELQWITLAGKPENDRLHIIAEGECTSEETTRQLADVLNGVLVLAESGLNDAKTRQQLDPVVREAYLGLLKSADVSKLDRGDTKSVRLAFEITPGFLESAGRPPANSPRHAPGKPVPGNASRSTKGHT